MTHEPWGDQLPELRKALAAGLRLAPDGDRLLATFHQARQELLDAALMSAVEHELLVPVVDCPDTVSDLLSATEPDAIAFRFNPQAGGPDE